MNELNRMIYNHTFELVRVFFKENVTSVILNGFVRILTKVYE